MGGHWPLPPRPWLPLARPCVGVVTDSRLLGCGASACKDFKAECNAVRGRFNYPIFSVVFYRWGSITNRPIRWDWLFLIVDNTDANMTTNVVVGPPGAAGGPAAAAHQRTVSTASIRSVVTSYVNYRSSLPSRRISNDSRRSNGVAGEDEVDGWVSDV